MGLGELKKFGASNCIVEGDFQTIISWGMGNGNCFWHLSPVIYEIRELISLMNVSLIHVVRNQNGLTDQLANWGIDHDMVHCDSCLLRVLVTVALYFLYWCLSLAGGCWFSRFVCWGLPLCSFCCILFPPIFLIKSLIIHTKNRRML